MAEFAEMSKEELEQAKEAADRDYEELKARNLSLDMSRGKPAPSQIDHANGMLKEMTDYHTKAGMDVRNYGVLDGIPEMKELFSELLDIPAGQLIVGGNGKP